MRHSLFLSTLFACSLLGGVALADKPHERPRAHGEVLDKSHRAPAGHGAHATGDRVVNKNAASRVSCGDASTDCPGTRSSSSRGAAQPAGRADGPTSRPPAFLQKVLGTERTAFNEAGEAQAMSARAASRVWSRAGAGATGESHLAHQQQHLRKDQQASANRTAFNEAGEASAPSKASKKEWSYQAVKAGTWRGPEAKKQTNAEKIIAGMRAPQQPTMDGQEQVARRTRSYRQQ
jgi:hypothetical protein